MATVLTTAAVERFKPKVGTRRWIRDAGARSLFLVIQPSGHKSWWMRFRRPDGRPAKLVLGPVDLSGRELKGDPQIGQPLTLVAARALAANVHRGRALGHDVVADTKAMRRRRRTELQDRTAASYGTLVRRFIVEHARPETRMWRATAMLLGLSYPADGGDPFETRNGLAERWGDRAVSMIDSHAVFEVIAEARATATPGVPARNKGRSEARARNLFAALGSFFSWAHRHRLVASNPCTNVFKPTPSRPRDRVLNPYEIRQLWLACDAIRPPYAAAVRLLLLTGCRLREIAELERSEVGTDALMIAGRRTKNHRSHVVPLAPLAREILAGVPPVAGCQFAFSIDGLGPITAWSAAKKKLDTAMGAGVPWVLHDLRRTAVTGMAELGIRPDVIELTVNHVSGHRGGIAGVYNKSELLPERRAALERWARFIGLVIDGDLYAVHEHFLAGGEKAREVFNTALAEGGERWGRYLKATANVGEANVLTVPTRTRGWS